jgi:hypothetical protein
MPSEFLTGEDIDARLGWWPGTARLMARRDALPHYRLPDGSVRFRRAEVEGMIQRRPAVLPARAGEASHG